MSFVVSCAGPGLEKARDSVVSMSPKNLVIWESSPRPVAEGNDAQLLVRTSESMNMLYAAHNEKGRQNLFMAKTKNIGDSFFGAIPVNSDEGEVSAHGENGLNFDREKVEGCLPPGLERGILSFLVL